MGLDEDLIQATQNISELKAKAYWDIQNAANEAALEMESNSWKPKKNSDGSILDTWQFGKDHEKLTVEKLKKLNQGFFSRKFQSAKPEDVTDAFVNLDTGEVVRQAERGSLKSNFVQADTIVLKPGNSLKSGGKLNLDDVLLFVELKSKLKVSVVFIMSYLSS